MTRRRQQRKTAKAHRQPTLPRAALNAPRVLVREADTVERLTYTRTQAAEALGIGRSTFNRRVLPNLDTIETGWGKKLIPVDELERYVAERRQPARPRPRPAPVGRPPAVPRDVSERIRAEHAAGKTFGQIARDLDADRVPTAQGGRRWWPSSVRAVLLRSNPPAAA